MRKYEKTDSRKGIFCERWTFQTTCCYKYRMKCELCPNNMVCKMYTGVKNEYKIHPVKYAMLLTYSRLGEPKGYLNYDTRNE